VRALTSEGRARAAATLGVVLAALAFVAILASVRAGRRAR